MCCKCRTVLKIQFSPPPLSPLSPLPFSVSLKRKFVVVIVSGLCFSRRDVSSAVTWVIRVGFQRFNDHYSLLARCLLLLQCSPTDRTVLPQCSTGTDAVQRSTYACFPVCLLACLPPACLLACKHWKDRPVSKGHEKWQMRDDMPS